MGKTAPETPRSLKEEGQEALQVHKQRFPAAFWITPQQSRLDPEDKEEDDDRKFYIPATGDPYTGADSHTLQEVAAYVGGTLHELCHSGSPYKNTVCFCLSKGVQLNRTHIGEELRPVGRTDIGAVSERHVRDSTTEKVTSVKRKEQQRLITVY